jgi:ApaG protein
MSVKTGSEVTTEGIRVSAVSRYLEARSEPRQSRFVFAYTIRIANEGQEAARLLSRHWIITSATGTTQEVKGPGVIGKQPYLQPGDGFEYDSFCPLDTEFGTMHGTYQMIRDDGRLFDVAIAPFVLARPHAVN